jgi:hypothetical protein
LQVLLQVISSPISGAFHFTVIVCLGMSALLLHRTASCMKPEQMPRQNRTPVREQLFP